VSWVQLEVQVPEVKATDAPVLTFKPVGAVQVEPINAVVQKSTITYLAWFADAAGTVNEIAYDAVVAPAELLDI